MGIEKQFNLKSKPNMGDVYPGEGQVIIALVMGEKGSELSC